MLADTVLDAIGRTPLLRLRPQWNGGGELYAKLELQNLFAMKDRVARQVILDARDRGELRPGGPIVESSSGTMALGLALVGRALDHPVHIVTDPRIDPITLAKLAALGCTVHVVEAMTSQGWQSARLERLAELLDELDGAFWPRQYVNPGNPAAYRTLADELRADIDRVDVLVGPVGSGGSLCGTARALREHGPVRVVGVDCVGSVLFGQPDRPGRRQSGLGNSLYPDNLDHMVLDEVHWLNDDEAFGATRRLAREQQLFGGNTSGSAYLVGSWLAERARPGTRIVAIMPDRGDRYTSTIFDDNDHGDGGPDDPRGCPRRVRYGQTVESWSYACLDRQRRPRFVFIEANTTGTGRLALTTAARLGFEPVLITGSAERYGALDPRAVVVCADTNDPDALAVAVRELAAERTLAAITTTSEFYLAATAAQAEAHGCPGNPVDAVLACRDKAATRRALRSAGLSQPRFVEVGALHEVTSAIAEVSLPCVVKPRDGSGSEDVRLCADEAAVRAQVTAILARRHNVRGQRMPDTALVEEYVDHPEFSVEAFTVDGATHVLGVTRKSVTGLPHFVEYEHTFPVSLPEPERVRLEQTVVESLKATGLIHGASHTEVKLSRDAATVVEINARPAGGLIPELVRLAIGVDLLEQHLRAAAGLEVRLTPSRERFAGIRFLLPPATGVLAAVEGCDQARRCPGIDRVVLAAAVGDQVHTVRHAYDRIGHIIAVGDTEQEVALRLAQAGAHITMTVRED